MLVIPATPASATSISSSGPLTRVEVSPDLNCAVDYLGDTAPEFYSDTACATLLASDGALYGPAFIPAGSGALPRTPFTPLSQSGVTGTGSAPDPFTVVTSVDLGSSGLRITQTDSYVLGDESYRTDVTVTNVTTSQKTAILYRAGDCFLQNSDRGFGSADPATGAVSCVAGQDDGAGGVVPGTRIEQWFPLSPGSHYYEDHFGSVWSRIGSQQPFPDACAACSSYIDNGAGLSWDLTVPAGGSVTRSHLTVFSPLGRAPLSTSKTADSATSAASALNGYTVTIDNPNVTPVTLDAITDTLPAGFTYTPGSTTGATTADPTITGQDLRWAGPIPVPASGNTSIHFGVTVSSTAGEYFNNAGGEASGFTVAPTGETAQITITAAPTETDLSVTKTDSPDPVRGGKKLTYKITVANRGPSNATDVILEDTLPRGMRFLSAAASQGSCSRVGRLITCQLLSISSANSATVKVEVRPNTCGPKTNRVRVTASESDPELANNSAISVTKVIRCGDDDDDDDRSASSGEGLAT